MVHHKFVFSPSIALFPSNCLCNETENDAKLLNKDSVQNGKSRKCLMRVSEHNNVY